MLKVYAKKKGSVVEADMKAVHAKKVCWIDCYNPTKAELEELSKLTNVPSAEFREHLTDYERPNTFEFEKFSLVVFGVPYVDSKDVKITSFAIYLFKNMTILTLRNQEIDGVTNFMHEILEKNPKYFDSPTRTVRALLESLVDDFFTFLDIFEETAERLEGLIFHHPNTRPVEEVFKLKKTLLFFHKALLANREVISAIEKEYVSMLSRRELHQFRDIYNDIVQLIDEEETLRDVLSGVMNIYMSSVSNNMNQIMKKLTVMASYVLIPTLIASIYGMNFRYMPEIPWLWGYPFAIGLMIFSVLALYFYFKHSKWV
ncbi:magnesium/cobalt transporter CorA [Candidatus Woesearchaeota archaeon]|nr:magnesium/cobalt transporter CorA [Candidatus Woesearchaeota archaeon]